MSVGNPFYSAAYTEGRLARSRNEPRKAPPHFDIKPLNFRSERDIGPAILKTWENGWDQENSYIKACEEIGLPYQFKMELDKEDAIEFLSKWYRAKPDYEAINDAFFKYRQRGEADNGIPKSKICNVQRVYNPDGSLKSEITEFS